MHSFPNFMKRPENRIAGLSQHTPGVEGYVFDGADGSQMAFWSVSSDAVTAEHVHAFDEYVIVVEGAYVLRIDGVEVRLERGDEYYIPRGSKIAGSVQAGTRTIHAFGGKRAERASP
jgi:ethanolamine utilization protein EutQ (cupin superfamily)